MCWGGCEGLVQHLAGAGGGVGGQEPQGGRVEAGRGGGPGGQLGYRAGVVDGWWRCGQRREPGAGGREHLPCGHARRWRSRGGGGIAPVEVRQEFALAASAKKEQDEGVVVEEAGDLVVEGGCVLARVAPVGAGAVGGQFVGPGQEVHAGLGCGVGEGGGHVAVEEGGEVAGLGGGRVEEDVPGALGKGGDVHGGAVGAGLAALYVGGGAAGGDGDGADVSGAGVGPAAGEAPGRGAGRSFESFDPGVAPPAFGEGAAASGGGPGREVPSPVVRGCGGHRRACFSWTNSASSASLSSVNALSPPPKTASARALLVWRSSAMRSSTVPSAIKRWTWTGWVWPMR